MSSIYKIRNQGRGHNFVVFETIPESPLKVWLLKTHFNFYVCYVKLNPNSSQISSKKLFRLKVPTF